MTRIILFVTVTVLALAGLLLGCGAPAPEPISPAGPAASGPSKASPVDSWEKLVADARKEGRLVVYANATNEVRQGLSETFGQKYGIDMEFIMGSGSEIANKLTAEHRANLRIADVILGGTTTALGLLKPAGIMANMEPFLLPENTRAELWIGNKGPFLDKADKMIVPMIATFQRYLVRNVDLVPEGEISSYADLLKPQYKGKIVMTDPSQTGTGNAFVSLLVNVWGEEKAKDFLRQFVKQEPQLSRDRRLPVEWVSRGKNPLGVATMRETTAEFMKMGAPIKYQKVKEGGSLGSGAGAVQLAANPPHRAAATLFINWLLSKEGQTVYAKAFGHPSARLDVSKEGFAADLFPEPGEPMVIDSEAEVTQRVKLVEIGREIFGPLLK
ncbi:MAG: extracellular solute-binding protein [Chloroflexi bacterium]|nr:extracellular solute-binding protein [Chloroflexota bacterium]